MMHYTLDVPGGARWTKFCMTCAHHADALVLRLSTFDAESVRVHLANGSQEFIGRVPTVEERASAEPIFGPNAFPVAAPADGDAEHSRFRIGCTRPSCHLNVQIIASQMERLQDGVRRAWRLGVAEVPSTSITDALRHAR